ncbi:MAG TPA: glycosyltransferase family 4 protein [Longimicrobium sp.]|nr:glycosyltransferase family 4 protein [Longimicrobium sp.]
MAAVKVAFLSASGQVGGAERVLLDLLASLRAAEPEWPLHLVVLGPGPLAERAAELGVTVHPLSLPAMLARTGDAGGGSRAGLLARLVAAGPAGALWLARLRRLLRRIAPGVVHTHGFKVHAAGALACPPGARLVWHVHDFTGMRPLMAGVLRRLSPRVSAALAVSRAVAGDLRRVCGPRFPVRVVYNAVDLDRFRPDGPRADLAALAGMEPEAAGAVRVGLVATMGVWKGHRVFIDAITRVAADLPLRAYVVGGRIYRTAGSEEDPDELRRMIGEHGLADRAGITGFVDDPADAMRALDVVVHASTQPEPFGLVIAEAMACGRPVIATAAGGAAEIVDDGVDALTVPPSDPRALADAIRRLAADAELRARMGAAGRAKAERRFDRARLAAEVIPIYRAVVEGS